MDVGRSQRLLKETIIGLNLVFVRFDAFLNNYVELIFIGLFLLIFAKFSSILFPWSIDLLILLNILAIGTHFVYSIVYIVNDYIDFKEVQKLRESKDLFSFYEFRPIVYFNRTNTILIYLIGFYLLITSLLIALISCMIVVYPPVLVVTALVHSKTGKYRYITFAILRALKYLMFLSILFLYLPSIRSAQVITASLILVIPFLAIHMNTYMRSKVTNKCFLNLNINIKSIIFYVIIGLILIALLLTSDIAIPLIKSIIFVSPFYFIRELLRFKLGPENPNFYMHLKRLLAFFISTVIILIALFVLLLWI